MDRIKRISMFFRVIFQLCFILEPIFVVIAWLNIPNTIKLFSGIVQFNSIPTAYTKLHLSTPLIMHTLSLSEKLLGFLINCIPLSIDMFMMYSLIQLFRLYELGKIFTQNNIRYIRNIAYALLLGQLVAPICDGFTGMVLTWNNPHGHRLAAFGFEQSNIWTLLIAGFLLLISWIMAEGYKLHEEHTLTV